MAQFSIGGVLSDTFANLKAGFGKHFAYALVPAAIAAGTTTLANRAIFATLSAEPIARLAMFFSPLYWIALLTGVICGGWSMTGIVGSLLADNPGRMGIGGMIQVSAHNIVRYLAVYLIWYLLLLIGTMLLIVPGLIALAMFAAAIPAMVDRDLGPLQALGASRIMTRGNRWGILGSLLVLALLLGGVLWAGMAIFGFNSTALLVAAQTSPLRYFGWTMLNSALLLVFISAYLAALYNQLGGRTGGDLQYVFA